MTERDHVPPLPFDKNKQYAIIGHLLTNRHFFLQVAQKMRPEWFVDPYSGKVLQEMVSWYQKHKAPPTVEEIKNTLEVMTWEARDRTLFREAITLGLFHSGSYILEPLAQELTRWYHSTVFQNAAKKSTVLYNARRDTEAYDLLHKASEEIKWSSFENDKEEHFDAWAADFESSAAEYRSGALTFGSKVFDRLLTPKAQKGSLLKGDTSIVLAPVNIGKSTSMVTVIRHNLVQGASVLWITHEGRPSDLKEKMWCAFLGVTPRQLLGGKDAASGLYTPALAETSEGRQRLDLASGCLSRFLTYLPMNKAGLTAEEVVAAVRFRQERRLAEKGKGYDLLVVDYPAKLSTRIGATGNLPKRTMDEVVYNYFVQLGLEYGFHVLLAIQSNREGSKVNKGISRGSDRLLTMEDVNESFGPMQSATNVWSINRDPTAAARGRLTYYIDKSRSSETGWAVVCRTNYAHSITHSDDLGATYYRGASTHGDKLDQLLDQYLGHGGIPDAALVSSL